MSTPRLVILGSGWASFSVLKHVSKKHYQVIVVSPRNHFLFTPLLCSTTVGTLEFRSIIEPVRNVGFEHSRDFHLSSVEAIDLKKKTIVCRSAVIPNPSPFTLEYDKLVVGVGALPNSFHIPGVEQYSYFLKEVADARLIRTHLLSNFEQALDPNVSEEEKHRLAHIVIVGGGPTGVEFGAELYDFCKKDVTRLYKDFGLPIRVTLIEGHKILASFDQKLQAYAEKKISQRENYTLIKSHVKEVKSDCVVLTDGTVIPCGLVVWSTGLAPRPMTAAFQVEKNRQGQILVDDCLNIHSDPSKDSYAIGDCASIIGRPLPCTAQVAERQGKYVADRLNKLAVNKECGPFTFKSMGMLAYIGGYQGLSDLPDVKLKGFSSWFLWRSAYFTRLGSWRLRFQVPLDWLKTFIFGRDTSRF